MTSREKQNYLDNLHAMVGGTMSHMSDRRKALNKASKYSAKSLDDDERYARLKNILTHLQSAVQYVNDIETED